MASKSPWINFLSGITFLYLTIPWIIFFAGWLRWPFAASLSLVLMIAIYDFFNRHTFSLQQLKIGLTKKDLLEQGILLLIALLWTSMSGAGGFGFQTPDWEKSNAILKDLIFRPWPLAISYSSGEIKTIVYYLAYYLPSAVVGRIWGWNAANISIFIFTAVGVWITIGWFSLFVGRSKVLAGVLFFIVGGLDFIGQVLIFGSPSFGLANMQWWSRWEFASHSHLLFWSPQHALGGWLCSSLFINEALGRGSRRYLFLIVVACSLWSPLVMLGLAPFLIPEILKFKWKELLGWANMVAAPALILLAILFFSSHEFKVPKAWAWDCLNLYAEWPKLALFYFFEFIIFSLFFRSREVIQNSKDNWWWFIIGTMVVCPLYYFGMYWDFTLRTSIPPLFMFRLILVRNLFNFPKDRTFKILSFLTLIGMFSALGQISRSLAFGKREIPPLHGVPTVVNISNFPARTQYIGTVDSFFYRKIAKPLQMRRWQSSISPTPFIVVEAESHKNITRVDHIQFLDSSHGGRFVGNDFGAKDTDSLEYTFPMQKAYKNGFLTLVHATEREGAHVNVILDAHPPIEVNCPRTQNWGVFDVVSIPIGSILKGEHHLSIHAKGVNINFDAFLFSEGPLDSFVTKRPSPGLVIEAEDFINQTRDNFVQGCFLASGRKIVGNHFGGSGNDRLLYNFQLDKSLARSQLRVTYSAEFENADVTVRVDGKLLGTFAFLPTGDMWNFSEIDIPLERLVSGAHTLEIGMNGIPLNLDMFYIRQE